MERQLIVDYEKTIDEMLAGLTRDNIALAASIAAIPEDIRGYGHVKAKSVQQAMQRQGQLLAQFRAPVATQARAA
jgi:indolepyruvate ferredoxin oxidoreductase